MILQLNYGVFTTITATQVEEKKINDNEIVMPNDGKKVTAAEFKIIEAKKMKEMGVENRKSSVTGHSSTDTQ